MQSKKSWPDIEERKPLTRKQYVELFLRQDGRCPECNQRLEVKGGEPVEVRDEHVDPLWRGGSNDLSNRELWCKPCTKPKDAKEASERAKSNRVRTKHVAGHKPKGRPIPGSRCTPWKKKITGEVVGR